MTTYITSPNNYDSAVLLNFSCPKSYYLINDNNNTFSLIEDKTSYDIVLTNGSYNVNTLLVELQNKLSGHSYAYTVSYNKSTNKYLFTASSNLTQPYFDFRNSQIYLIIGFEPELYQFAGDILRSVNVCYLQLTSSLLLCCDFVKGNVLSQIVSNVSDFGLITYEENNPSFASHELTRYDIKDARFYLLDANTLNPISLNGIDFSFSFVLFKKNVYYHNMLIDQQIQLQLEGLKQKLDSVVDE